MEKALLTMGVKITSLRIGKAIIRSKRARDKEWPSSSQVGLVSGASHE